MNVTIHNPEKYLLSHVGSLPDHVPSAWHVLVLGPFKL